MSDKPNIRGEVIIEKRLLTLTAYAPLKVVTAGNYLRYGPTGVRRFGPNATEKPSQHPHEIEVQVVIKNSGGERLTEYNHVILHDSDPNAPFDLEGTNLWIGMVSEAHLEINWVWDFYRMFSGVKLAIELPEIDGGGVWAEAVSHLRQLKPGGQIVMSVHSASGDILQVYPVDEVAFETN